MVGAEGDGLRGVAHFCEVDHYGKGAEDLVLRDSMSEILSVDDGGV